MSARLLDEPIEYVDNDLPMYIEGIMVYFKSIKNDGEELVFTLEDFRKALVKRTNFASRFKLSNLHSIGMYWSYDKELKKFQKTLLNFGLKGGAFKKLEKREYITNFH